MLNDLLAVMWAYPQVYIDVGAISFALPRAGFHGYLRRIVEAGFVKRVMFGSDQMIWPEVREVAIQSIEQAANSHRRSTSTATLWETTNSRLAICGYIRDDDKRVSQD